MFRAAVALATLACASEAIAQTSNCITMGGGMVHCHTMGRNGSMSSTDCMSMGGNMATCYTMDMSQPQRSNPTPDMSHPQTGGTTLEFIGDLIARSQERSFQKKVGQMLASGDCQDAANLALARGRFDMSNEIRRSCQPKAAEAAPETITTQQFMAVMPSPAAPLSDPSKPSTTEPAPEGASQSDQLTSRLRLAAAKANAATPMALDEITTVSKVEAIGSQILLTASVNAIGMTISEPFRVRVQNDLCADQSSPALLTAGASIRIKYFERSGKEIGSVMVTRAECGL